MLHFYLTTTVLDFLSANSFTKDVNGLIKFLKNNVSLLPSNKKIIILSATANETLYKQLFGERLHFVDIGLVEQLGEIEQITNYSFSRYSLENNTERLPLAQTIAGNSPVVTYKDFKSAFPNAVAHFGGLTGLDQFGGQDLVVVGTPHMNPDVYLLYGSVLGYKMSNPEYTKIEYREVEYHGCRFMFNTYQNKELQEIQLSLIESELIQAVGRARTIRNNCKVTVLSNFPVLGATFRTLPKEEINQLINKEEI